MQCNINKYIYIYIFILDLKCIVFLGIWYYKRLVFCDWAFRRLAPKACADMSIWRTINPLLFLDRLWCIILYISWYYTPPRQLFPLIAFSAHRNCVSSYHSVSKHWEMACWCWCIMRDGGEGNCLGPFSKPPISLHSCWAPTAK